jgi:hypothetical protein
MAVMHPTNPAVDRRALQRKVVRVLALGQILGGLGVGATLALGALLVTEVSGSSAWSGMAATMNTLGAALLAVPLARLAQARGRRISLSTGAFTAMAGASITIGAAVLSSFPVLLLGLRGDRPGRGRHPRPGPLPGGLVHDDRRGARPQPLRAG